MHQHPIVTLASPTPPWYERIEGTLPTFENRRKDNAVTVPFTYSSIAITGRSNDNEA